MKLLYLIYFICVVAALAAASSSENEEQFVRRASELNPVDGYRSAKTSVGLSAVHSG